MSRIITFSAALREAMAEEMRRDAHVYLMGQDIRYNVWAATNGLAEEFGLDRVMHAPISENGFVSAALGSALIGCRPVVELMYSDFLLLAADAVADQLAKYRYMNGGGEFKVPVTVRAAGCGVGSGSGAHHAQDVEATFIHYPGLKIVVPSTPHHAKGLLKTAIRDDNPVMFLEQKLLYRVKGEVPREEYTIPFGVADIKRQGCDCTLITYGRMVHLCLEAAEALAREGLDTEVIDIRTLLPLDTKTLINSVIKTKHCVIVHEAVKFGGFGGEIAAAISESDAFYYLDSPVRRLGALSSPIPFNPALEKNCFPTVEGIIEAVRQTQY